MAGRLLGAAGAIVAVGLLLLWSAAARAQAAAGSGLTLRGLATLDTAALDQLYATAAPGPIPTGKVRGRAIVFPGSPLAGPASGAARLYWQGKVFSPDGTSAVNRFVGIRMIRGNVGLGPSWKDGGPAIILDYQGTSRVYGRYRDEIRQVAPGLYLGLMYERSDQGPSFVRYFAFEDAR